MSILSVNKKNLGNNLVGEIYRILITDNAAKQKSLILKIAPKDENRRKNFNVRCVFIREIYMYDQVNFLSQLNSTKCLVNF